MTWLINDDIKVLLHTSAFQLKLSSKFLNSMIICSDSSSENICPYL